jgi:hypothetical protein
VFVVLVGFFFFFWLERQSGKVRVEAKSMKQKDTKNKQRNGKQESGEKGNETNFHVAPDTRLLLLEICRRRDPAPRRGITRTHYSLAKTNTHTPTHDGQA